MMEANLNHAVSLQLNVCFWYQNYDVQLVFDRKLQKNILVFLQTGRNVYIQMYIVLWIFVNNMFALSKDVHCVTTKLNVL